MGAKIYPRFELVHEFKETTQGNDVHFISLSNLIELFSTDQATIETIRSAEKVFPRRQISSELKKQAIINADSKCQLCKKDGLFDGTNGTSFLEIHFIKSLSDGGQVTLDNIVLLCPNCNKIVENRFKQEIDFIGGSPCQMSGQICPNCRIGVVDVSQPNQDGASCNICGFYFSP